MGQVEGVVAVSRPGIPPTAALAAVVGMRAPAAVAAQNLHLQTPLCLAAAAAVGSLYYWNQPELQLPQDRTHWLTPDVQAFGD